MQDFDKIFDFLYTIEDLKKTVRYKSASVELTESVADHSWRLAMTTMIVANHLKLDINIERAIKIALVHDLGEYLHGDVEYKRIYLGTISKDEKHRMELEGINSAKNKLPKNLGEEIYNIWKEYDEAETREAKFVKALDKMEAIMHVHSKGHETFDIPDSVATYADKAVSKFPELKEMLHMLKMRLKEEFEKGNLEWKKDYEN